MSEKNSEQGFKVIDKRIFGGEEREPEEKAQEIPRAKGPRVKDVPEVQFASFIISLSSSALVHLGEIPDPVSKEPAVNLPLARQSIDLIALLQEKTKGNLTPEEERLFRDVLYNLRIRYVQVAGENKK